MSLSITTTCPIDYDAKDKSRKWDASDEVYEERLLLKLDRHFNPTEGASSSKAMLGENAMKEDVPEKRWRKTK